LKSGSEERHIAAMKASSLKLALVTAFAVGLLVGCVQTVREGKYATNPNGGWDNFRAQAPTTQPTRSPADS
jgi:hypothetical protein